jgi:hypothetical protein
MPASYCYSLLITLIGHAAMPAAAETTSPAATDTTAGATQIAATSEEQNAELVMLRGEHTFTHSSFPHAVHYMCPR